MWSDKPDNQNDTPNAIQKWIIVNTRMANKGMKCNAKCVFYKLCKAIWLSWVDDIHLLWQEMCLCVYEQVRSVS